MINALSIKVKALTFQQDFPAARQALDTLKNNYAA